VILLEDGQQAVVGVLAHAPLVAVGSSRWVIKNAKQLTAPGGNAYTNRRAAACLRDLEIILRYVTYAIFAGDASILEDRSLNGLRETYVALGTPGASVAAGVEKLKEASIRIVSDTANITQGDCSSLISELSGYFDRAASAVA